MTHQQLTDFFKYAEIPFGSDSASLRMLKKHLLLELKSSINASLRIADKDYNQNDILKLFENTKGFTDDWSPYEILKDFPILDFVIHPEKSTLFTLLPGELSNHPDYEKFKTREAQPRFGSYLKRLSLIVKNDNLHAASSLLVFIDLFSYEQQFQIRKEIKLLLKSKFSRISQLLTTRKPISSSDYADYFITSQYYEMITAVGSDDNEFLFEQLEVADKRIAKEKDIYHAVIIYTFQVKLPFEEFIMFQVENILKEYKLQYSTKINEEKGSGIVGIIGGLIFVIILIFKVGRGCHSTSSYRRNEIKTQPSYNREIEEQKKLFLNMYDTVSEVNTEKNNNISEISNIGGLKKN